jgi:hypothetical protein
MMNAYKSGLIDEGTFLGKRETVRWLISDRFVFALAVSAARSITRHGLRGLKDLVVLPCEWYLPSVSDEGTAWPLQKALLALYAHTGMSQTEFHYPDRMADEANLDRQRDLENAQNWTSDRSLPSAAALRWNVQRAFDARPADTPGHFALSGLPTQLHFEVVQAALLSARCATYACKAIAANFGAPFLSEVCERFRQTFDLALAESHLVEKSIALEARRNGCSPLEPELRNGVVQGWSSSLSNRVGAARKVLNELSPRSAIDPAKVEKMAQTYGALAVRPLLMILEQPSWHDVPPNFAQGLGEGMALWKASNLSEKQVDLYEQRLKTWGADRHLPWMVHWLRFVICYRREDDALAWHHISIAYEQARYRAGSNQYKIVNHYIEMAAKMQAKVAFRRGVNWARYIGISVRWLREEDLTTENIASAMAMLRIVRYRS